LTLLGKKMSPFSTFLAPTVTALLFLLRLTDQLTTPLRCFGKKTRQRNSNATIKKMVRQH
jgi:hypothetical protein